LLSIIHNSFEESLMRSAGYPVLDAHHQVHESFRKRALNYKSRLEKGENPLVIAREARTDIGLWLMNHIRREDKHYVPYVQKFLNKQDKGTVRQAVARFFGRKQSVVLLNRAGSRQLSCRGAPLNGLLTYCISNQHCEISLVLRDSTQKNE